MVVWGWFGGGEEEVRRNGEEWGGMGRNGEEWGGMGRGFGQEHLLYTYLYRLKIMRNWIFQFFKFCYPLTL